MTIVGEVLISYVVGDKVPVVAVPALITAPESAAVTIVEVVIVDDEAL